MNIRRSRPGVFYKKGNLRNFAKLIGKHLYQRFFFKKNLWHRCFPVSFAKFLRTRFFTEHVLWLLLKYLIYNNTVFENIKAHGNSGISQYKYFQIT